MSRPVANISNGTLLLFSFALCHLGTEQTKTVEVTDGRPVAKAVQMLEGVYGVPITYEDPIAVHGSQLQDVTGQVQRTPDPSHKVIVQKDVTFSFALKPTSRPHPASSEIARDWRGSDLEVSDAISSVLDGYMGVGGPVTFTATEEDGIFHIIPSNYLDGDGKMRGATPILDTKITIPPKERTADGLLGEICQALSKSTDTRVWEGTAPTNLLLQRTTTISGSNVTARSLLNKLLVELANPASDNAGHPDSQNVQRPLEVRGDHRAIQLSWQLFYGPGWGYVLNLHRVTLDGE
ncbi:MAG: hypothetical protein ABSG96_10295 [Terracidiphilus sp.]|jgi:hypothetical protein